MYEGWDSMLVPLSLQKTSFFRNSFMGSISLTFQIRLKKKDEPTTIFFYQTSFFMVILILVSAALIKALFFTDFSLSVNGKKAKQKTVLIASPRPRRRLRWYAGENGGEDLEFLCYYNTYKNRFKTKQIYLDSLGKKIEVNKWSLLKKCY